MEKKTLVGVNDYYEFDSLSRILQKIYGLGFYRSVPEVLNISVENKFEGWSGRASETWETRFTVELHEVSQDNGTVIFSHAKETGRNLEEACAKILKAQENITQ